MTEKEIWQFYIQKYPELQNVQYEAWSYGSDNPDELVRLTLSGKKTATASAYPVFLAENSPIPQVGDHNIILYTDGTAACIIRDTHVCLVPFAQVSADHAWKEGEGNRSLASWRRDHQKCFSTDLSEINQQFSEDMLVVCEEFRVVFRP